jgi:pimeloyl-ACP methyl ester carboxylesterase
MARWRLAGRTTSGQGGIRAQGTLGPGMAYLRAGTGPVLVFLPGLSAHHRPPRGVDRWFQLQQIRPLSRGHEVWWIQRRAGLPPGVTMPGLAADYAEVLGQRFGGPVDVVGVSTGGSVALQLAADHPGAVRRLVLVSSGCALGPHGRAAQRRVAALLRQNKPRQAGAVLMSMLGATPLSRRAMAALGWLLGTGVAGRGDPDLLATIDAEDTFDLTQRLSSVTTPTLVAGGARDAFYDGGVFEQTAALLPRGCLTLYQGKGHMGTTAPRLTRDVLTFLDSAHDSS